MLLRATENALAGHIWPAGRYFPTPALGKRSITRQYKVSEATTVLEKSGRSEKLFINVLI